MKTGLSLKFYFVGYIKLVDGETTQLCGLSETWVWNSVGSSQGKSLAQSVSDIPRDINIFGASS